MRCHMKDRHQRENQREAGPGRHLIPVHRDEQEHARSDINAPKPIAMRTGQLNCAGSPLPCSYT
jgi:hypothetical protein